MTTLPTRPPAPPTMEQAGLTKGSRFIADEEETAAIDEAERQRIAEGNAEIDRALADAWRCSCCGIDGGAIDQLGRPAPDGLCSACSLEAHRQRSAEAGPALSGAQRAERVRAWRQQHDQQVRS